MIFEAKDYIQLGGLALTLAVSGFIGPRLAVWSSLRQFQSQKWHERQIETYTELLERLAIMVHWAGASTEASAGSWATGPNSKLTEQLPEAVGRVSKIAAMGPFLISEEVSKALDRVVGRWYLNTGCGPHDECEEMHDEAKRCLEIVRSEARIIRNSRPTFWKLN